MREGEAAFAKPKIARDREHAAAPGVALVLNLLTDPWLPVVRQSGRRDIIRPAQIAEADDPLMALDWPRADFRIAGLEFLIGLLATACPPEGARAWLAGWEAPPDPAALDAAFAPLAHAFNLDGEGPRFLQDFEDLVSDPEPVERLLIEAPGESATKQNTDLLVRRGRVLSLGRAGAAMALFTLQSWAPEGGRGNLTGLRGGGPLTTLVMPGDRPTLWRQIWANTPVGEMPEPDDMPRIFPWLAATVTSKDGNATPEGTHPSQCWWGMPRRIRLDFSPLQIAAPCSLTGVPDGVQVRSWRQRPNGTKYVGWGKVHPLTPYAAKAGGDFLPLHPQPGGIGYRDWIGLVVSTPDGMRLPAKNVSTWRGSREIDAGTGKARLLAAGYDMKSMKARAFLESEMPLPEAGDAARRKVVDDLTSRLVLSANQVAGLLRSAVRFALFSAGATVKLDSELLSSLRESLWEQSEGDFFALLATTPDNAPQRWLARLHSLSIALFDEAAPLTPENGGAALRIGRARRNLIFSLTGFGKEGEKLFAELGLPAAQSRAKKKGKAA